jgi:hypothetical protein
LEAGRFPAVDSKGAVEEFMKQHGLKNLLRNLQAPAIVLGISLVALYVIPAPSPKCPICGEPVDLVQRPSLLWWLVNGGSQPMFHLNCANRGGSRGWTKTQFDEMAKQFPEMRTPAFEEDRKEAEREPSERK